MPSPRRRHVVLIALAAAVMAACGRKATPAGRSLPAGATVLALGDSITYGSGAPPAESYPAQLAAITGWKVVNAGVPGDTAAQAIERLPALLAEHRPALVILSVGGNDFLRRLNEADTEAQLRRGVTLAREAGAQVLLVAVPRPTLMAAATASLTDHPMYERVAGDLQLNLHRDGWSRVLSDDKLKSDQIHANARGYRAFAEGLVATLRASKLLD